MAYNFNNSNPNPPACTKSLIKGTASDSKSHKTPTQLIAIS